MRRILNFKLEKDRWFVDLPEWIGEKDDLEMVMGADTMLTLFAQGEAEISLLVSDEPLTHYAALLDFDEEIYDGAMYMFMNETFGFNVWLCAVTKFVFGEYPKTIYIDF